MNSIYTFLCFYMFLPTVRAGETFADGGLQSPSAPFRRRRLPWDPARSREEARVPFRIHLGRVFAFFRECFPNVFHMALFGQVEAEALPEVQPTVPMPGVFLESIQNDKCILFGVKFKDHTKYSELYSTLSTGGPARRDFCRSRTAGTRQKQRRGVRPV